jgi:Kef-type K+ transport system membrane component KefB
VTQTEQALLLLILLVGAILILAILVKAGLERIGVPALVGYVILGLLVNAAEQKWHLLSAGELEVFEFLADIGIICLLALLFAVAPVLRSQPELPCCQS